jgi:LmbE family N-acetylglucosaminyl deacetylase
VLTRRRVIAGAAGLFVTNLVGGSESAHALTKKKAAKGKKPIAHAVSAPSTPNTLDPQLLTSPTKQVVFYAPHPDDELLSFGVIASEYISLGYEVVYVLLTNGATSTAIKLINGELPSPGNGTRFVYKGTHNPVASGYKPLTVEDVGRARLTEFKSSAGEMNIGADHIYTFDLLKEDVLHGEDVATAMLTIRELYPDAIHWTMSTMDLHPHHRVAGESLRLMAEANQTRAAYTISRTTWESIEAERKKLNPLIPATYFFKPAADRMQRIRNAALPYNAWNPQAGSFAIGYASVAKQFEDLDNKADAQYCLASPTIESVESWITSK